MAEICVDFDGTCVTHEFPEVGKDIGAVPVLKELIANGHQLILWTMRSDDANHKDPDKRWALRDAINWFKKNDIGLHAVEVNPTQHKWTSSRKCYAHHYIDDAAIGCPLVSPPTYDEHAQINGKPVVRTLIPRAYVDWRRMRGLLVEKGLIK